MHVTASVSTSVKADTMPQSSHEWEIHWKYIPSSDQKTPKSNISDSEGHDSTIKKILNK